VANPNQLSSSGPDDEFEGPSDLFEPISRFKKLKKFWKTRDSVLAGVPLYEYSKAKLSQEGLMGPWEFNVTQSTLAGLPGSAIAIASAIFIGQPDAAGPAEHVIKALDPMIFPFVLMFVAYTVGWSSLWKRDSNRSARMRAARIYLYLDGVYGFAPQCAVSTLLSLSSVGPITAILAPQSFALYLSFWQLYVSLRTIPEHLFRELGYTSGFDSAFTTMEIDAGLDELARKKPPLWKYRLAVLLIVPLIGGTVLLCFLGIGMLVSHFSPKM